MIGKVPPAGRGFKGLVSYLLRGEKGSKNNPNRVAWTDVRNMAVEDPHLVPALMRATAGLNRRCRSPVYHFVISWRHDEHPTEDIMRAVGDRTCDDLELSEYQRLYVAHADTRHQHLHIVVNRIHPETHKAWNRRQDWVRIEQSLADQSREMGFDHVPGRHNEPEPPGDVRRRPADKVFQRERRAGIERALKPWDEERVAADRGDLAATFDAAQSWEDLDQKLAEQGLVLARKGQGFVIADRTGAMKASSLGKAYSRKHLEERWGERPAFDPPDKPWADERRQAFAGMRSAHASLDFAFALYNFGLIGKKQLEAATGDVERAGEELDRQLTFRERVDRELARSLKEPRARPPSRSAPFKPRQRDDDERDR
jgi:hypothetical protein